MGKLAQHRSKTVDALIEESIAGYLERSNFNDTNEIALLLIGMDVDIQIVKYTFSDLDKIIQRRHQVVHRADRADRVEVQGKGKHYAQSLRPRLCQMLWK